MKKPKKLTKKERLLAMFEETVKIEKDIQESKDRLSRARTNLWNVQREIQELAGIR